MKSNINLSLIIVYNNKNKLNKELLDSLQRQTVIPELILLDSSKYKFQSASQALNYGASLATKDFYVFLHQDIIFLKKDTLERLYKYLINNKDSIIGIAGKKKNDKKIYSTIVQGPEKIGFEEGYFKDKVQVHCLDECLMACHKNIYLQIKFDEIVCNNWDFYVCDFCFTACLKNINIYCVNLDIWHTSLGHPKHSFYKTLRKLCKKYKGQLSEIRTCCIYIPNKWYASIIVFLKEMRNSLLKIIRER